MSERTETQGMDKIQNKIYGINGPVVTVEGRTDLGMLETVYVGNARLVGEVIRVDSEKTTIQVYEETTSLKSGEPVVGTGLSMSVLLGPGIIGNIFDGIQRPLKAINESSGAFIARGCSVSSLDEQKLWQVSVTVKPGDVLKPGEIYAVVPETQSVEHRCMLSPLSKGGKVVRTAPDGEYRINDTVAEISDEDGNITKLSLVQRWPIRTPRPSDGRLSPNEPLVTGQRIIDTLFPLAKGGAAAIPGGFGTGKTTTQHQLARWCDADIIIYVGCGERGNEMTQVLTEFSELTDPRTGKLLLDRTVLIANTSNMPVAAREASVYTGITLAEYYRDMGYDTALMADSTSRWAEALREISGRLEEMPGDEGFPAYLPSRLAEFYERSGTVNTLSHKRGSVSIIGAVSPQGSDFSEPVTQNTKRFIRCFWALDKNLAYARHFPAINWIDSYSEYALELEDWYRKNAGDDFIKCRDKIRSILLEENRLMEIVKLIGADVLPEDQKLIIEISRVIRLGYLQQEVFNPKDTYVTVERQLKMMQTILHYYDKAKYLVDCTVPFSRIAETGISERIIKLKYTAGNDELSEYDNCIRQIDEQTDALLKGNGGAAR